MSRIGDDIPIYTYMCLDTMCPMVRIETSAVDPWLACPCCHKSLVQTQPTVVYPSGSRDEGDSTMKRRFSITEVAHLLGMRERSVVQLAGAGKIPHRKVGKEYFFDEDELFAWWNELPGIKHSATMTATPSATNGIQALPGDTAESGLRLVRGPKGRNRERLAKS